MKLRYLIPSLLAVVTLFFSCSDDNDPTYLDEIRVSESFVSINVDGGSSTITLTTTADWAFENIFKQTVKALSGPGGGITVHLLNSGAGMYYELDSGSQHFLVIHANGTGCSESVDASGYSVYLDTLGKLSGEVSTVTPEKYQTLILVK